MQHEMQHKIVKALIFRYFLDILYGFDSRYLLNSKKSQNTRNAVKPPVSRHFLIIVRNNKLLIYMTQYRKK